MAEWTRLDLAEEILGYRFRDTELGTVALSTWRSGFSRLEFLGDAVLGLAVGSEATLRGHGAREAVEAVTNRILDARFRANLAICTSANSGDVIEALVGAIHLDGGFELAASVSLMWCGWSDLWEDVVDGSRRSLGGKSLAFIGAATLSAVVADTLCRTEPRRTHEWYSTQRSNWLRRERLARISVERGLAQQGHSDSRQWAARASDHLERQVAEIFLNEGWEAAVHSVFALGVIESSFA